MTLGIVNDVSRNVDADFLMPSMTRFGDEPPIKWSKVKRKMMQNYPLFTPQKGTTASLNGGMQTLVDALVSALEALDNVQISFGVDITTPEALAEEQQQPLSSIVWCAPLRRKTTEFSHLNVYAVGFTEEDSRSVPVGYGTLIPDPEAPISGVLHESDVHASPRAPKGHRLFRLMSPVARGATEEDVKRSLRTYLCEAEPVVFEKIGERRIPSYPPGYMASLKVSNPKFTRAGWFYSGVSITHVVAEAERIADVF
jgi:protoporphyrinogen oxidase